MIQNTPIKRKSMPRTIGLLTMAIMSIFFVACGDRQSEKEEDHPDVIRRQITEYRKEINELTVKVNEMERSLIARGEQMARNVQTPVSVDTITPGLFQNFFRVSGTVEAVNTAVISPETSGHVTQIYVNKGDQVSRGQIVARLSTDVLEGNVEEVKTSLRLAETVYERQKRLWAQEIGSEIQYLEARNNVESLRSRLATLQSQLEMSVLRSPIAGYVDETNIKEGELAMPGTPIMKVINLDELYINSDVSEANLSFVERGKMVTLRFPAFPDEIMETPIHRIGHVINPENRSFRMQLRIANQDERFKPNMMANVSIATFGVEDAVVIPSMLIGFDTQGHYVYTAGERNGIMVAHKTYIERGPDAEGKTQVKSGLAPGDKLIVRGHHRVSNGDPIRIIENGESEVITAHR
ncbi:MAG: efflux RND transporter periplasmic adaptor subunit [Bacteroidia bacterium]|nr:MAG: efflux RND transporter periplasmic adaptor subunit [Bacteroidia bacterium]